MGLTGMSNAVFVSLSQQIGLRKQMDAIAQNLANMNTGGYRSERVMFEEYLFKTENGGSISYVEDVGVHRDMTTGRLEQTSNELDVALDGPGYLVVVNDEGTQFYTRQGHFELDADRNLVTSDGLRAINRDNLPITFGAAETAISVSSDGTISSKNGPIGSLRVVKFEDDQALVKYGNGLLITDQAATDLEPQEVVVEQGMMERSNVVPILEMTRMIDVMRSYKSTQKLMNTDHDLKRKAIRDIIGNS
jgi:flagellar basal-body rod protein FlgF